MLRNGAKGRQDSLPATTVSEIGHVLKLLELGGISLGDLLLKWCSFRSNGYFKEEF